MNKKFVYQVGDNKKSNNIEIVIAFCCVFRFYENTVAPAVAGKAVRCDEEDNIKVHFCEWNRAFRVCEFNYSVASAAKAHM